MTASELIAAIERAGGEFILDVPNSRILFGLGQAPRRFIRDLEREREQVAAVLLVRQIFVSWPVSPGARVQ